MSSSFLAACARRLRDACVSIPSPLSPGKDELVSVARELDTPQSLAAFLSTTTAWRSAVLDWAPTLFYQMAVARYPRIEGLVAAIPFTDFRELYRAQQAAEQAASASPRTFADYVFTVELYWKRDSQQEICGSWTGRFDATGLNCHLWQVGQGPEWSRVQRSVERNGNIDWATLHLRVLVTRTSPTYVQTVALYDDICNTYQDDENDPDKDFWLCDPLPGADMTSFSENLSSIQLIPYTWLPAGRVQFELVLFANDFGEIDGGLNSQADHAQALLAYLNKFAPFSP